MGTSLHRQMAEGPNAALGWVLKEWVKGTPQGGVISPLLMNLFMHYVFDKWMAVHEPRLLFARYADDALVHCSTLREAERLQVVLEKCFRECHLELHPEKSKIFDNYSAQRKKVFDRILRYF